MVLLDPSFSSYYNCFADEETDSVRERKEIFLKVSHAGWPGPLLWDVGGRPLAPMGSELPRSFSHELGPRLEGRGPVSSGIQFLCLG